MSTKTKPRLGRGLSSLIAITETPVQIELPPEPSLTPPAPLPPRPASPLAPLPPRTSDTDGPFTEVPVGLIAPNPHQPRQQFDDASIAELAASIRSTGLIQPLVVRKVNDRYELIAGERRLRAAKLAGLSRVPALVRDVDAATQAQMALIENIQREDLNPIDRAAGYRTLIDQLGLTQVELAGRLGEDRSTIANFLRLLDLAEPVKALVRDGRLSLGHAKLIAGVADLLEQDRLAQKVLAQNLTVRNLERLMREEPVTVARKAAAAPSPHIKDLEKTLRSQLGMRVQVKEGAKQHAGKLVIHYVNLDQFDDLLERLGVKAE